MDTPIGEKTVDKAIEGIRDMLYSYLNTINRAYLQQDNLVISCGIKLQPHNNGVMVGYNVSFVESKVKDSDTIIVNENQQELQFGKIKSVTKDSVEFKDKGGTITKIEKVK